MEARSLVGVSFPRHLEDSVFSPDYRLPFRSEPFRQIWAYDTVSLKADFSIRGTSLDAISPDDRLLAVGGEIDQPRTTLQVWARHPSRVGFQQVCTLEPLQSPLFGAAFSPDSSLLAISANDGLIRLYQARSLAPVASVEIPQDSAVELAFSPNGHFLAGVPVRAHRPPGEGNGLRASKSC